MVRNMKIRMAVFLCIVMVLPSIVSVLPMTATEVSAASDVTVNWDYYISKNNNKAIQVEKGQKFNIGDYVRISDGNSYKCASMLKNVSYKSSKKSVATVDSKGNFNAKKTGTTTITVKYKGQKITYKFKVVKAGTFGNTKAIRNLKNASKKVASGMPGKITVSNGYKYLQKKETYYKSAGKYSLEINSAGFLIEPVKQGNYTDYTSGCKLAVPQAGRINYLEQLLYQYSSKNSPTSTRSSKGMKIASVSASTSQITIKVKNKVTADHILAANIEHSSFNEKVSKNTAKIYVYVYDQTAKQSYTGVGTITKGSKTVKVKIGEFSYNDGKTKFSAKKLKKGHTYVLGYEVMWGYGKKVRVK